MEGRTQTDTPQGTRPGPGALPKATLAETLMVAAEVLAPILGQGVIIRRPRVLKLADKLDLNRRAVKRLQQLRNKYGTGPLMLAIPGRSLALILSEEHIRRVLDETPEPFATATLEKRAALSHFQPRGVLISHGLDRADRRQFNEQALDSDKPVHRLAERFLKVVDEEAAGLLAETRGSQPLTWDRFSPIWFRVVRRVVLGDAARDDEPLRDMINELRAAANWAYVHPEQRGLRERFLERVREYLQRAESGSLAQVIAETPSGDRTAPEDQVAHWLFAFDPGGMTTFRALALLAAHPEHGVKAREEIRERTGSDRQYLPFLRSCVLESLRLWPTTPLVLRETTEETLWETGVMPLNTSVAIFAPVFHRDEDRLAEANRFSPGLWEADQPSRNWPLVPFSAGPGVCPARHLVLLLTSTMLSALLGDRDVRLNPPSTLDPRKPMPGTLNHLSLRFEVSR